MSPKEIPVDPNNPLMRYTCISCGGGCFGNLCDECAEEAANKIKWETYEIPRSLFEKFAETYSADTAVKDKIRGTFIFHNQIMYTQSGLGFSSSITCCFLIPEEEWDGPTYSYGELEKANGSGGFFHCNNHLVSHGKQKYVVKPNHFVIFKPIPEEKQISMF